MKNNNNFNEEYICQIQFSWKRQTLIYIFVFLLFSTVLFFLERGGQLVIFLLLGVVVVNFIIDILIEGKNVKLTSSRLTIEYPYNLKKKT